MEHDKDKKETSRGPGYTAPTGPGTSAHVSEASAPLESGKGQPRYITVGDVTVKTYPISEEERQRNIREGQEAFARAMDLLITPGVTLDVPEGVPLFHSDPDNPEYLIRVLGDRRERGVLRDGEFVVVEEPA